MARANVIQFYIEYRNESKAGAHQIQALISSVHRNSITGTTGVDIGRAGEIMDDWGFSDSAKIGLQDIYNLMVAGTIDRADFDNALMLADVRARYHTTGAELADRLGIT